MANPSQPELRRSERGATVDDHVKATASHATPAGRSEDHLPERTVPDANRPGADHPRDKHQPDLDKFAERLGLHDEATEPRDGG